MLKKIKDSLSEENDGLQGDKELNDLMVQEKIVQVKQQKELIRQVRNVTYMYQLNSVIFA